MTWFSVVLDEDFVAVPRDVVEFCVPAEDPRVAVWAAEVVEDVERVDVELSAGVVVVLDLTPGVEPAILVACNEPEGRLSSGVEQGA